MSLWKYKYFVDVVDCKSFTKAGKKNFVTQAAISQQVVSMEKAIGGKLLDRQNGELIVTEIGQVVYDRAKEMLEIESHMYREIEELRGKATIHIGIDTSISERLWAELQNMVDKYFTEETFHFSKIDLTTGSYLLLDNVLDFFIGYGILPQHKELDIEELEICKNRIGIYLGKNTTVRKAAELTAEDLKGHKRYATQLYPCSIVEVIPDHLRQTFGNGVMTDNIDTMKLRVELKDGYALVDSHYFSAYGETVPVLSEYNASCVIKIFYKKNWDRKKIHQVLKSIQHVMESE